MPKSLKNCALPPREKVAQKHDNGLPQERKRKPRFSTKHEHLKKSYERKVKGINRLLTNSCF